jgi:2-dehydro-3-deoxyglucarate aldolase
MIYMRSRGYSRAGTYGADFDGYKKRANDDITIILQIEHIDAVRNIDEILSLKGFDGTFIGPLDLAGSMGVIDNLEDPSFKSSLKAYLDACKKYKKPAGMHIVRPDINNIKKAVKDGYKMIALGLDVVFLEEKSKEIFATANKIKVTGNHSD